MSPRVFDGWVPTEVHEHFDADGTPTGYTVVTRETEWDDESRGRALRLAEYKRSICPCGCNLPIRVGHDPERAFRVEKVTCRAGAALRRVQRRDTQAHANDPTPGWDDGLAYYVVPHDDD